jgi:hypothetical protein
MKDGIIADCDQLFFENKGITPRQFADDVNKKPEVELSFDCWPEPFSGNPESKVYCLNMNPGEPDYCFDGDMDFAKASIDNMLLNSKTCFWADNIKNKCGKLHGGVEWLAKRTKTLKEILERQPEIFFLEYFPYHSTKGFAFPQCLPSYDFTNALIYQAMDEGKLIIIMREKQNWLKRINGLSSYPHLYTLKYAQGGYLTQKNIIDMSGTPITDSVIKKYF